METHTINNGS